MIKSLTWNIEGLKSSVFTLTDILSTEKPHLVFLSESQAFQHDAPILLKYSQGSYYYYLNSDDRHDYELSLSRNYSVGGTLVMWLHEFDPFVTIHPTPSTAFTPLILKLPGWVTSVHIALYLPTSGKDVEFINEISNLRSCMEELAELLPDALFFIRGDSNVNIKNKHRVQLFNDLIRDFSLTKMAIGHKTYHHFTGQGKSDSEIDVILYQTDYSASEKLEQIMCRNEHPGLASHHDIIFSSLYLPPTNSNVVTSAPATTAPRLPNSRVKVHWTEEGTTLYKSAVSTHLRLAREHFLEPSSESCFSLLLKSTNTILNNIAGQNNRVTTASKILPRSAPTPRPIKRAKLRLNRAHRKLKSNLQDSALRGSLRESQKAYKSVVRKSRILHAQQRDSMVYNILESNPKSIFTYIKKSKSRSTTAPTQKLKVGTTIYEGDSVADGFFDSMTNLKTCDLKELSQDPDMLPHFLNYEDIMKICKDAPALPKITFSKISEILSTIKRDVRDHFSVTARHYINAGDEGILHLMELVNAVISNTNNASSTDLNIAHGIILYKGHNKDKSSERSYRTISTCPFTSKVLDLYIRDLYCQQWDTCQAPTQYQGRGTSHELAALLLTEAIQHSLYTLDKPVYVLSLDAQSAFDRCLRQILVCELYKAGVDGSGIQIIDNRLKNRATVYEWNNVLVGPGFDDTGFEQGAVNSSDYYKLYNNEQLTTAQRSNLGVPMNNVTISAIGQADDVVLISNDIDNLYLLSWLTERYCQKYRVKLVPSKTTLLAYCTSKQTELVDHAKQVNRVTICGQKVQFSTELDHVGITRSNSSNLQHIANRITAHKKAMAAVLSAGIARSHRGNPAASLRILKIYGTGVLFSGVASLVLSTKETNIIDKHFQNIVQNLQKLYDRTPRSITFLLAGCLPGEAVIHMKQLTLFRMICNLPNDPLHSYAKSVLASAVPQGKSWFNQILKLCIKYSLPHPHQLLLSPPAASIFKCMVKKAVLKYWTDCFHNEASSLESLHLFHPMNYSLQHTHSVWTSAKGNPFECHKAVVLARMISGRYRTEKLVRHWSTTNREGYCMLDSCNKIVGSLEHMLITCPGLQDVRQRMRRLYFEKTSILVPLQEIVSEVLSSSPEAQLQLILDHMAVDSIRGLSCLYGPTVNATLFYCSRTYVYYLQREKAKMLNQWSGDFSNK